MLCHHYYQYCNRYLLEESRRHGLQHFLIVSDIHTTITNSI